jgi:hypothetical protein
MDLFLNLVGAPVSACLKCAVNSHAPYHSIVLKVKTDFRKIPCEQK